MKVKSKKSVCIQASPSVATVDDAIDRLFNEISPLITAARERVAVGVNTELTKLNWNVGNCINREILGCSRAEYGKQVVKGLASRLMLSHGSGWDEKTLRHCLRAAETFGEEEIVSAARRQLSWTHIKTRYNGICHDRFIIVDQKEIFWTGASLKDAVRLTFAARMLAHPSGSAFAESSLRNASHFFGAFRRWARRADLGKGFTQANLRYMRLFYLALRNCHTLCDELSWSHYRLLISVENEEARAERREV